MSYPDYPNNRLIVNGTDLSTEFGLILLDGYTLEPPKPKVYTVNIPGGNGVLDLTESLLGDTAYENRKHQFIFNVINPENFEQVKTNVSNFLHGKAFDYQITMDPNYTYHGRFSISSYDHDSYSNGKVGIIKMDIDAEPFKYLPDRVYKVFTLGGNILNLDSGRKRVRPIIETDTFLKVIFNSKLTRLQSGTWRINDLLFTHGTNEIYFNSRDIRIITWKNLKDSDVTWGEFKEHRLFEWYKSNGQGVFVLVPWYSLESETWSDLSSITWGQLPFRYNDVVDRSNVYIKYEVGDL